MINNIVINIIINMYISIYLCAHDKISANVNVNEKYDYYDYHRTR